MVRGVWATSAAWEEFNPFERANCVENHEHYGPQLFAGGVGFAVFRFPRGRTLVLAERNGVVSLMTEEEPLKLEEALSIARRLILSDAYTDARAILLDAPDDVFHNRDRWLLVASLMEAPEGDKEA